MKQQNYIIIILGLLAAIGPFSIDMYLPAFPAIASDLNTSLAKEYPFSGSCSAACLYVYLADSPFLKTIEYARI